MELLFLWWIFGLIAVMLAMLKGRNVYLWLLLAIVLGPVALFIVHKLPENSA